MTSKNRVELKQYIRFQLAQMSARNDQHLFERAAFELARQRISANILPATGPVQAGGDQGRDFESFRAHISGSFGSRGFVGRAQTKILVFACTLQKTLPAKIRSDLKTIFAAGAKPDIVYYFAEPDLPVAARHKLQEHCRTTYNAELEVLDGQAIADMLADSETFWIAEHFFAVPSEMFPAVETDQEYQSLRDRWLNGNREVATMADFLDVKRGLRAATKVTAYKVDLNRWLLLMSSLIVDGEAGPLERRAMYEVLVANLRGRGSLDPVAETVATFFDTLPVDPSSDELEDAAVASSYCLTAGFLGHFATPNTVIAEWRAKIVQAIEIALSENRPNPEKYVLLLSRAQTALHPDGGPPTIEALAAMFDDWRDALTIAAAEPLCDVSHFDRMLELFIPIAGTDAAFAEVADMLDEITAAREGAAAVAERCRQRALAHLEADQPIQAIDQLQRVKEGWFAADTLRGSILAMMLLGQTYRELHLPMAARYYAMAAQTAAMRAADENLRQYAARSAFEVANSFLAAGEGISYLAALGTAFSLHAQLEVDPGDFDAHPQISFALAQATKLRGILLIVTPDLIPKADEIIDSWPLEEELLDVVKGLVWESPWKGHTSESLRALLAEEVGQALTNDLGGTTNLSWRALGIQWTIRASADVRLQAEQLAATLQILLVDFAEVDLLLVPSDVEVTVLRGDGPSSTLRQEPDNGILRWTLTMPKAVGRPASADIADTLGLVAEMLFQTSALPEDDFQAHLEARLERGLLNRVFWAGPAGHLLLSARRAALPSFELRSLMPDPGPQPMPLEAAALAWRDTPAQGYSRERADEYLRNRYQRMTPFLRKVAPSLMADPRTAPLLLKLHDDGLLDWQVMAVVFNLALQHETGKTAGPYGMAENLEEMKALHLAALDRLQDGTAIDFDPLLINAESVDLQVWGNLMATLKTWKLELHRQTPNFGAVKRLLDARFGNATDDVPHEDVFGWPK